MGQQYPRLSIEEFGANLLDTGDLDPLYIALHEAKLERSQLKRWLLSYWCFYNAGVASWLSNLEGTNYWDAMKLAAANSAPPPIGERWPRGQERRHFRGAASIKAVTELERFVVRELDIDADPAMIVSHWACDDLLKFPTCKDVMDRVKRHHLFGPWIAFKVADMVDRVLERRVEFTEAEVFMFDSPREAALTHWFKRQQALQSSQSVTSANMSEEDMIRSSVQHLTNYFAPSYKAPPLYDRPVGLQEIETILCKWKSHCNGHYPLGNDTREIRHTLREWASVSRTAAKLLAHMPEVQAA